MARLVLRCCLCVLTLELLLAASVSRGRAQPTALPAFPLRLRHANYVGVIAEAGVPIRGTVACIRHGAYEDALVYTVLDSRSEEVHVGEVLPGASEQVEVKPRTPGLHVFVLTCGWNLATIDLGELPHAIVAKPDAPMQTVGRCERLYFFVPEGTRRFDLFVSASVTREGARLQVFDPDGRRLLDEEGEFDIEGKLTVTVPGGGDGRPWSLAIVEPETPGMGLDDVMLRLDAKLPPYLAKKPEWAALFGKRRSNGEATGSDLHYEVSTPWSFHDTTKRGNFTV